jgi:hypothetical protein
VPREHNLISAATPVGHSAFIRYPVSLNSKFYEPVLLPQTTEVEIML